MDADQDRRYGPHSISNDNAVIEATQPAGRTQPIPPEDALIIGTIRKLALFPGLPVPANIGRERKLAAAQEAVSNSHPAGVLLQRDPAADMPGLEQLHRIGTTPAILRCVTAQDEEHNIVCNGQQRFRIVERLDGYSFIAAWVQLLSEPDEKEPEVQARLLQLEYRANQKLAQLPHVPREFATAARTIPSASADADFVAGLLDLAPDEKQGILQTPEPPQRRDKVLHFLVHRIDVLRLSQKIDQPTKERMDERKREFQRREHLKTIRRELGEIGEQNAEIADLAEALAHARLPAIRGQRRTYIGARPGNISQAIRKPGMRNLSRGSGRVCRHVALRIASGEAQLMHIVASDLPKTLVPKQFDSELAMRTSLPGVAPGPAWTPVGGDILFVEASRTPGGGWLILTGQLVDVMKERAQAAITLVEARSGMLPIAPALFEKSDIHVHVPAGAEPKDGPSAGVAMFIALASLLMSARYGATAR